MKKNLLWILSFALLGMLAITSCNPEDTCVDADCVNGSCFDGGCTCDVGYALDALGFCTDCAEGYEKDIDGNCVEKIECDDADCPANASCVGDECLCDIGYEDDGAGGCVLEREKFLGTYDTTEPNCGVNDPYEIVVEAVDGSLDLITFRNLGAYYCEDPNTGNEVDYHVEASVLVADVTIDNYETCGTTFDGIGNMDLGTITVTYSATYFNGTDTVTDNCTAILVKR